MNHCLHITKTKKCRCFWSQSPWGGPELMSLYRGPYTWGGGRQESQWVGAHFQGRRIWAGQPHLEKSKSISSGEFISNQRFQQWFKIKLLFILSLPPASPYVPVSGKPTGYKHSVPGSGGQKQPARHLDLPLGLMTSRSIRQKLFKAGNRSPGALNINKYLVNWFLPCFSKGNLLPGLSL